MQARCLRAAARLVDSAPMERLQRLGVVFAFLIMGVVLVSLYATFRLAIEQGHWIAFLTAILMGAGMVAIFLKVGLVPDRRHTAWVRSLVTNVNSRYLFTILLILWFAGMGLLAAMKLPDTQLGGLALIGLFAGVFIFMGFIWSVIGE